MLYFGIIISMNKKDLVIASIASVITISGVSAGAVLLAPNTPSAGADDSPIVQTLSNHELRIKNTENNVKDLQTATGTPESSENVPVTSPASTPTLQAQSQSTETIVPTAGAEAVDNDSFDMSQGNHFTSN